MGMPAARYLRVALSLAGSAILLFSCGRGEDAAAESGGESLMTEYSEDLSIVSSQNGRRAYHFVTPLLEGYTLAREPYREFPKGVKITTYKNDSLTSVDAVLTASVPPAVTADTGIDVFTHAVEALVSTAANDFSDAAAEKSIKLVRKHLLTAYREPDNMEARQGMHNASCLAGVAFSNSGLGLNHGMAHALGARFHIPHGRANGILLPYVMSFNAGCSESLTPVAKRYARIARLLGLESSSVRQSALNLIRTARKYVEQFKIPSSIQAAGVNKDEFEAELDAMAEAALADRCTATNPKPCTKEDILQVFRKAYVGKIP